MYISSIQETLMEIISNNDFNVVRDFMVKHGARREEMTDVRHLAYWIEGAPGDVKNDFLDMFNEEDDPQMRICSKCGCFMDEGYLLDTEYACSDACAIALYNGDEAQLRKDIKESIENGEGDFFWTQWY